MRQGSLQAGVFCSSTNKMIRTSGPLHSWNQAAPSGPAPGSIHASYRARAHSRIQERAGSGSRPYAVYAVWRLRGRRGVKRGLFSSPPTGPLWRNLRLATGRARQVFAQKAVEPPCFEAVRCIALLNGDFSLESAAVVYSGGGSLGAPEWAGAAWGPELRSFAPRKVCDQDPWDVDPAS